MKKPDFETLYKRINAEGLEINLFQLNSGKDEKWQASLHVHNVNSFSVGFGNNPVDALLDAARTGHDLKSSRLQKSKRVKLETKTKRVRL